MIHDRSPRALLCAAALSLVGAAGASGEEAGLRPLEASQATLEALRWEARPVLVFAGRADDPAYRAQMRALAAHEAQLQDYEVVVLAEPDPAASELREALQVEGFATLLVGKDGGVKLREAAPVDPARIFALIDRMPMRKREVHED